MKQILQNLKTGVTEIVDVPAPAVGRGRLLIRTSRTLVSAGTERMLVDFGRAGWIEKARQQPEKVKQVLDKIRTDGLMPTVDAVFNKLDEPMPLGYCNAGVVVDDGMVRQAHHDKGAVFDFYAGNVKRSHPWFLKHGLEWLPRLLQEPRRLWQRSLISAPVFFWHVFKQRIKK